MQITKLLTLSILITSLSACVSPSINNAPTSDKNTLSDADLIRIAKNDNRQPLPNTSKSVIGIHNGIDVVEEFTCSDICPENTLRIVYYDIKDSAECARGGGVIKTILIPVAITVMPKPYCLPAVIADYWESYP
ncbi:hypothetical protein [Psychrobacter sp. DM8]|uniref:hypothetical protein n=1 Tax=Psychrobacter sp. DM8 TaxID=3440636 RepID=UPI003F503E80